MMCILGAGYPLSLLFQRMFAPTPPDISVASGTSACPCLCSLLGLPSCTCFGGSCPVQANCLPLLVSSWHLGFVWMTRLPSRRALLQLQASSFTSLTRPAPCSSRRVCSTSLPRTRTCSVRFQSHHACCCVACSRLCGLLHAFAPGVRRHRLT